MDQFLNISIGHITSKYDIEIKEYDDKDIDEALRRIKYRLLNVENTPYFLDIKRYARITILANKKTKELLAKKFLLELSSKYYYDDFYLAIYSEDLYTYKDFFGLPQLFFNNNRLTLNKKIEVQELNSIKFEKPIILFACDHLDFEINNNLLKIIYFNTSKTLLNKFGLSKNLNILDTANQIFGNKTHIENGILMNSCTRKKQLKKIKDNSITQNVEKIILEKYAAVLYVGDTYDIPIKEIPNGYSYNDIVLKSSDNNIVGVNKGQIIAKKMGSCEVKIMTNDQKYEASINILVSKK